jgi:hypothetical protein
LQHRWDQGCSIDAFDARNLIQCCKDGRVHRIEQFNSSRFLAESELFRALCTATLFAA